MVFQQFLAGFLVMRASESLFFIINAMSLLAKVLVYGEWVGLYY
jgi:hypothetical protein